MYIYIYNYNNKIHTVSFIPARETKTIGEARKFLVFLSW